MDATTILGWMAALLVLVSFSLKSMASLRLMAAVSNVAFIAYGMNAGVMPILVLHALLLPINLVRLLQARQLRQEVEAISRHADISMLLMPHMQRRRIPAGQILFRKGEPSDVLYYVLEGEIFLQQSGRSQQADDLIGIMGCFTPDRKRLDTAVAKTEVELCSMPTEKVRELMIKDSHLSHFLLQTVAHRASGNFAMSSR